MSACIRIGTAGWAIPRAVADRFPGEGSGLARYSAAFDTAEINSTFYREHRPGTLTRWAQTVPQQFRFSVKLPRTITHDLRLAGAGEAVSAFVASLAPLARHLGPLLVQLPPSLAFNAGTVAAFFGELRAITGGLVACEPRHASWFSNEAQSLLRENRVAQVVADPLPAGIADEREEVASDLLYVRLHGSPRMYYSSYDDSALMHIAERLARSPAAEAWCIFDNTASGAAASDALRLQSLIGGHFAH